jgi:iron complex outermembrane receptor protein
VSVESGQSIDGDGSRTSVRANVGLPWGADGFVNLSGETTRQHHAIRTRRYIDGYLSYPAVDANGNLVALRPNNRLPAGASPNPAEANRNAEANTILSSPSYALKAFAVNVGHGLGESAQFYANATASDRTAGDPELPPAGDHLHHCRAAWRAECVLDGFLPVLETKRSSTPVRRA